MTLPHLAAGIFSRQRIAAPPGGGATMAWADALVGTTKHLKTGTAAESQAIPLPSGWTAGDTLILVRFQDGSSGAPTLTERWSTLAGIAETPSYRLDVARTELVGGDGGSVEFAVSNSSRSNAIGVVLKADGGVALEALAGTKLGAAGVTSPHTLTHPAATIGAGGYFALAGMAVTRNLAQVGGEWNLGAGLAFLDEQDVDTGANATSSYHGVAVHEPAEPGEVGPFTSEIVTTFRHLMVVYTVTFKAP